MLTLYRKDGVLYGKCIIKRLISGDFKKVIKESEEPQYIETMVLLDVLKRNEYVLMHNGSEFVRPKLYNFAMDLENKNYRAIDIVEERKTEPKKVIEKEPDLIKEEEVKEEKPDFTVTESPDDDNKKKKRRN